MTMAATYGSDNFLMWLFIIMCCSYFIISRGYLSMSCGQSITVTKYVQKCPRNRTMNESSNFEEKMG